MLDLDPGNIEVFAKVLDGCAVNGHYWVFVGGLTDVEVELAVVDPARIPVPRNSLDDWARSHPDFGVLGVGYAFVEGSSHGHYWTQTFGAVR